ncbi:MAG: sensor histidine kinase [Bacillota bacterium]
MSSLLFIFRHAFAWFVFVMFWVILWITLVNRGPGWIMFLLVLGTLVTVIVQAFSHVRRVRLIGGNVDASALASRHRRQIEIPLPPSEAFEMVDAAIRELPRVDNVESTRDSLQVFARVKRMHPYTSGISARKVAQAARQHQNLVLATISPGENTGTLHLVCEPEGPAWVDWFLVDDGTNYENAEAITRAVTRRISERRRQEESQARDESTEKALAVAKLNLLHAQVEPHFLYNTLASAQLLTRSDPPRADRMLGNLITYLRTSMPRAEEAMSTLGEELTRAAAYLDILQIRMGERLATQIQVPESLRGTPLPPMMLQTLVENAIKHGLEPIPSGGTLWIMAREADGKVAITVADDGRGFSVEGGGTGIGLKNVRERLRLVYGDAGSLSIVANFPKGVAATLTVPREMPKAGS